MSRSIRPVRITLPANKFKRHSRRALVRLLMLPAGSFQAGQAAIVRGPLERADNGRAGRGRGRRRRRRRRRPDRFPCGRPIRAARLGRANWPIYSYHERARPARSGRRGQGVDRRPP